MSKVAIVIPTWNNLEFLRQTILSLVERTAGVDYRIICVPNGCTDGTVQWLQNNNIQFHELGKPSGFIKSTNAGLEHVEPDEHVLLLNDDVRVTDPHWLARLVACLDDPEVGAVGPTSNFILGVQDFRIDNLPQAHEAPFLIGLCFLIRNTVYQKIGKLDESFGVGTNEDLDYSLSIRELGYKLLVDRSVFIWHYGSRSLLRAAPDANLDSIQMPTRETLIRKWGTEKCNAMFHELRAIIDLARASKEFVC